MIFTPPNQYKFKFDPLKLNNIYEHWFVQFSSTVSATIIKLTYDVMVLPSSNISMVTA